MNNRQKIVVSIVGIFIVILALIGITYAYFLTRISGNTNTKSIEVTTADLALVYADGNGIINNGGNKLMPGNTVGTKTFTVTNTGEDEIEDYIVYLEDVVNPLGRPQDLVYTITCSQVNATSGEVTGTCNGVSDETVYPKGNSVLLTNDIASGLRHEYTFTLNYLNPNENQTEDMNKTFSGKINIYDAKGLNPYSENTNTLAYNIINNSISATNGTQLRSVPLTTPGVEGAAQIPGDNYTTETIPESNFPMQTDTWKIGDTMSSAKNGSVVYSFAAAKGKFVYEGIEGWTKYLEEYDATNHTLKFRIYETKYEKELSITNDDYGTSYYYRGKVEDNYVSFNNMCWRIVRVQGDGSIKIILADKDAVCSSSTKDKTGSTNIDTGNYGYTYNYVTNSSNQQSASQFYLANYNSNDVSSMKTKLNAWLTNSGINQSKLKNDNWCLNDTSKFYDAEGALLAQTKNDIIYNDGGVGSFLYGPWNELMDEKKLTLNCEGTLVEDKIGALTANEIMYAGSITGNFANPTSNINYLLDNTNECWNSLSINMYDPMVKSDLEDISCANGYVDLGTVSETRGIRPSVTLISGIEIAQGGNGTLAHPYVIQ